MQKTVTGIPTIRPDRTRHCFRRSCIRSSSPADRAMNASASSSMKPRDVQRFPGEVPQHVRPEENPGEKIACELGQADPCGPLPEQVGGEQEEAEVQGELDFHEGEGLGKSLQKNPLQQHQNGQDE